MDIAGLLDDVAELAKKRNWTEKALGGGIRGATLRGLLGFDAPEDATSTEKEAWRTGQALSNTPTPLALAVAPAALVKASKATKALPQEKALETARQNAVKMLGLPESNTAADRARALAEITDQDVLQRAHQFGNLNFDVMPITDFKGKLIYKSPVYNKQQSSEYRLGNIDGEPAYLRKSNHWDKFTTNIKESDPIARQLGITSDDIFGRVGSFANDWQLKGGITDKNLEKIKELKASYNNLPIGDERTAAYYKVADELRKLLNPNKSEAGYIKLSDLIGKIPEKKATLFIGENPFEIPVVTLKGGEQRSRFAAFDPARINEKDLLASLAALGIGVPMISGLLQEQE